jgi:hypothetical protein
MEPSSRPTDGGNRGSHPSTGGNRSQDVHAASQRDQEPPADAAQAQVVTFIANALTLKLKGNPMFYNTLIQQLNKRDDMELLWRVYHALVDHVGTVVGAQSQNNNTNSNYNNSYNNNRSMFIDVVNAVFAFDWRCDRRTTMAVVQLVTQMVSLNATYVCAAFDFLVRGLLVISHPTPDQQTQGEWLQFKSQLIHSAIRTVLALAPSSTPHLLASIAHAFPYKRVDLSVHTQFTQQILAIAEYVCSHNARLFILDLILSKCLEMDVEIVIEESGETKIQAAPNEDATLEEQMFVLDQDEERDVFMPSAYTTVNTQYNSRSMSDNTSVRIPDAVADMADKLDALLVLVVEYINKLLAQSHESVHTQTLVQTQTPVQTQAQAQKDENELFAQLLNIFEDKIFMTHRSKFVQFVVFYVVGKCPQRFGEALCVRLLKLFYDTDAQSTVSVRRQTAVMYLGSLLARCTALSAEFVSHVLEQLIVWASAYAQSICPNAHTQAVAQTQTPAQAGTAHSQQLRRNCHSLGSSLNLNLNLSLNEVSPNKRHALSYAHNGAHTNGNEDNTHTLESARKRNKSNDCLSTVYQQQERALMLQDELTADAISKFTAVASSMTVHTHQHHPHSQQQFGFGSSSYDILDELGRKARPLDSLTQNESFYSCVQVRQCLHDICIYMCVYLTLFFVCVCRVFTVDLLCAVLPRRGPGRPTQQHECAHGAVGEHPAVADDAAALLSAQCARRVPAPGRRRRSAARRAPACARRLHQRTRVRIRTRTGTRPHELPTATATANTPTHAYISALVLVRSACTQERVRSARKH